MSGDTSSSTWTSVLNSALIGAFVVGINLQEFFMHVDVDDLSELGHAVAEQLEKREEREQIPESGDARAKSTATYGVGSTWGQTASDPAAVSADLSTGATGTNAVMDAGVPIEAGTDVGSDAGTTISATYRSEAAWDQPASYSMDISVGSGDPSATAQTGTAAGPDAPSVGNTHLSQGNASPANASLAPSSESEAPPAESSPAANDNVAPRDAANDNVAPSGSGGGASPDVSA